MHISLYYESYIDEITTVLVLHIGDDDHMHGMKNLKSLIVSQGWCARVRNSERLTHTDSRSFK